MQKGLLKLFVCFFIMLSVGLENLKAQKVYFKEGFEIGKKPDGWSEEAITGTVPWRYRNGGYNPADPNLLTPPQNYDMFRNPDRAKEGTYNSWFFTQGFGREQTRLITSPIDLNFGVTPVLSFWLTLHEWRVSMGINNDVLRVFYKVGLSGGWKLLQSYNFIQNTWRDFQIALPQDACQKQVYFAFEGLSRWGMGVCLDNIKIEETGAMNRTLTEVAVENITTEVIPNGTNNNPILCSRLKVNGNQGVATLKKVTINAIGTNLSDITQVKLYATSDPEFNTSKQIATGTLNGASTVLTPNIDLETGYTYIWATYDIAANAKSGNIVDAAIPANGIEVNTTTAPSATINSAGTRTIKQNLFFDDFETDKGWMLSGDFEIATPQAKKGLYGNPDPSQAFSGIKVLGNDLTKDGIYDANVPSAAPYTATSPKIDASFYRGIILNFKRWLNADLFDTLKVQASNNNGVTWETVWYNSSYALDDHWISHSITLPSSFDRKSDIRIRYTLSYSNSDREFTGWNIDDMSVIGNFMEKDLAMMEIVSPTSTCGSSTGAAPITLKVRNAGSKEAVAPIPVKIFINSTTVIDDNITQNIAPGAEATITLAKTMAANLYGNIDIKAQLLLPGDEDVTNDTLSTKVYISKTYPAPYSNNFDTPNDWVKTGYNWMYGISTAPNILGDSPTDKMWITNLNGNYENNAKATLTSPCFDIEGLEKPMLEFRTSYITELGKDGVTLSYSIDNGTTWLPIGNNGDKWDNLWGWDKQSTIASSGKVGFSGNSGGWININHLLPASLNGATGVKFRFEFTSDALNNIFDGVGLNAFTIKEAPDDFGISDIVKPVTLTGADVCGGFTETEKITFLVKNLGIKKAKAGTTLRVAFQSNYTKTGGTAISKTETFEETYTLPADLDVNAVQEFISTKTIDMNRGGSYEITVKTIDTPENFYLTNNDSFTKIVIVNKPIVDLGPTVKLGGPNPTTKTFDITEYTNGFTYTVDWETKAGAGSWVASPGGGNSRTVTSGDFISPNNKITYKVTLTDPSGCSVSSTTAAYKMNPDVSVYKIVSPIDTCSLKAKQLVKIRLRNTGLDIDTIKAGVALTLQLDFNGVKTPKHIATVAKDIAPGDSLDYTFPEVFDMSATGSSYALTPTVAMQYDVNAANDILNANIKSFGYPAFTLTPQTQTVKALDYTYDVGAVFKSYLWHDATTLQTDKVSYPGPTNGKVWCTVMDNNGCSTKSEAVITFEVKDIAIKAINNLKTACTHDPTMKPALTIENRGNTTIASGTILPFDVDLNGVVSSNSYTLTADMAPATTSDIILNSPIDLSAKGDYTIKLKVKLAGDLIHDNDILSTDVKTFGLPQSSLPANVESRDVQVTLDAGSGFTDYLWSTNETNQNIVVSKSGNFKVKITDANLCSNIYSTDVLFIRNDLSVDLTSTYGTASTICSSNEQFPITIKITNTGNDTPKAGTRIPVSYKFGNTEIKEEITLLADFAPNTSIDYPFTNKITFTTAQSIALSAMITVDDETLTNNFTKVTTVIVNQTPVVDLGVDAYSTTTSFTISPILTPDLSTYTYLWNTGATSKALTVTQTGSYKLTVNNSGCTASDEVLVNFNRQDISMISADSPKDGCFTTAAQEVIATYKNTGAEPVASGTKISLSYVIGTLTATEEVTLDADLAVGSTKSYTFAQKITNLAAGTYAPTVTVTYPGDGISTNNSITGSFTVKPLPTISLPNPINVNGTQVDITGPDGMTSYSWSTGAISQKITVNKEDTYTLTVTDANGCKNSQSTQVVFNSDIELTSIVSSSLCQNAAAVPIAVALKNVSGNVIAKGSTLTFSGKINGVDFTETQVLSADLASLASATITLSATLSSATAGQYPLTVEVARLIGEQNIANNSITGNVTVKPAPSISLPNPIKVDGTQVDITGPDGMASYSWSTGASSQKITVNQEGSYTLTVTDANGCKNSQSTQVMFNSDIELTSIVSSSLCQNAAAEPITVTIKNVSGNVIAKGSTLTFSGKINGTDFTEQQILGADLASLASATITLSAALPKATAGQYPLSVEVVLNGEQNTSNNKKDATITVNASPSFDLPADIISTNKQETITGPAGMASYLWSNGGATQSITVNQSGTYILKVTNEKGCSTEKSITVQFKGGDIALKSIVNSEKLCQSGAATPITLVIGNDGDMPISKGEIINISLKIDGVASAENFVLTEDLLPKTTTTITLKSGLPASTTGKTVTLEVSASFQYDANNTNATAAKSFVVVASPSFSIDIKTVTNKSEATLTASKTDLTYLWATGATTKAITVYENSVYKVTGTNADGCSLTKDVSVDFLIPVSNNFVMVYPVVSQTKCYEGMKTPFEVKLVNESLNTTVAIGTDIKVSCTYQIPKPDGTLAEYKFSGIAKLSEELKPGKFTTYRFASMTVLGKSTENLLEEIAGKQSVSGYTEISSKVGTTKTTQFEIYPIPAVDLGNDIIYRPLPGVLKINLSNDYTFLWSTGQNTSSIIISDEGKYWVRVTSKNGCTASDTVVVKQGSEDAKLLLNIYPNPASSVVNFEAFNTDNTDITIELYSANGMLLESKKFTATSQAVMLNYDISHLESGSYAVIARTKDKKIAKILVVNR